MHGRAMTVLAAMGLAAAACGGDGTGPDNGGGQNRGTFQATVSGDLSLNITGEAVFGVQTQDGTSAFVIALARGTLGENNSDIVFLGRDNTAAPGVGTYPIHSATCGTCTADDFTGAYVHQVTLVDIGTFLSDTGQFVLSTASADTLRGTFELVTSAFLVFGNVTADSVRLEGSFTAVAGQVPGAP